jgi:hypothetical protein
MTDEQHDEEIEQMTDEEEIVQQAKQFSQQFGSLIKVATKLEEIGSLRKARAEARTKLRLVRADLSALKDQQSDIYRRLYSEIEAALKSKYEEAEELLAQRDSLVAQSKELTDRIIEQQARSRDLDHKIDRDEARYRDLESKVGQLRQGLLQLQAS